MKKHRRSVLSSSASVSAKKVLGRRRKNPKISKAGDKPAIFADEYALLPRLRTGPKNNEFRYGDYLHVSDLIHKCVRMVALSYRFNTKLSGQAIWDNLEVTFAIGEAIHDYVRNKVAGSSPGEIYGTWSCVCGSSRVVGTKEEAEREGVCSSCNKPLDQYHEFVLEDDEYGITGSVDLTLLIDGVFYFTEIKSIKKEDWDSLERPLPDHILQIVFYWWLAQKKKLPIYDKVSILYVTKGHVMGSPYKEFVIDPQNYINRLEPYLEDAKSLVLAKKGGPLPIKLCPNPTSPQAKRCEMVGICFSIDQ